MDSSTTTLFTFLYQSPPAVRTVDLLGSWDNFTKPYSMSRDSRRGSQHWSGCFQFDEIVFDGDGDLAQRRSGGLKMGGRYWFYYRLNGDVEAIDKATPSTTACPLLPGQTLNVLEVPVDSPPLVVEETSYPFPLSTLTMNPDDRYVRPQPPSQRRPAAKRLPPLNTSSITLAKYPTRPGMPYPHSATDLSYPRTINDQSPAPASTHRARRTRSASGSPSAALRSAYLHLRGARGSASDNQERGRTRTQSNSRDMKISYPMAVSRVSQDRQRHLPSAESSPVSSSPRRSSSSSRSQKPLFSPLRCHPLTAEDDRIYSQVGGFTPLNPSDRRDSGEFSSRSRRSSYRLSRESSPCRVTHAEDGSPSNTVHVPEEIQEVEDEGEASPRLASAAKSAPELPISPEDSTKHEVNNIPRSKSVPQPNLDKELPELPVGQRQLKSRPPYASTWEEELENEPSSRFSVWTQDTAATAVVEDDEGSVLTPTSPSSPASPTFSSTATSSSLNTPYRLSLISDYEESSEQDSTPQSHSIGSDAKASASTVTLTQPSLDTQRRRQGILVETPGSLQYRLPDEEIDHGHHKATGFEDFSTEVDDPEPARLRTMEQLVDEFAYLGQTV